MATAACAATPSCTCERASPVAESRLEGRDSEHLQAQLLVLAARRWDSALACRLFGLHGGERVVSATSWLLDAPGSLAAQSCPQPDGFGIGAVEEDGIPEVDKGLVRPGGAGAPRTSATAPAATRGSRVRRSSSIRFVATTTERRVGGCWSRASCCTCRSTCVARSARSSTARRSSCSRCPTWTSAPPLAAPDARRSWARAGRSATQLSTSAPSGSASRTGKSAPRGGLVSRRRRETAGRCRLAARRRSSRG